MASKQVRMVTTAVLLAVLAAGVAAQGPRVAVRDQVTITVAGDERQQFSGKFTVDKDGVITYPLVGAVHVAGMSVREIEIEIGQQLKKAGMYATVPAISVELVQQENKSVSVTGAVRNQMQVKFSGEKSLLAAILDAGSTTADAGDQVQIVRVPPRGPETATDDTDSPDPDILFVSLSELLAGRVTDSRATLKDGDIVIVETAKAVTIMGAVQSTGPYRLPAGSTVRTAIAHAGGLSERGATRGIKILRDGKYVKDVTLDTVVQPGDTIIVKNRAI
jgi:polysaccharide export outer membrane protein